MNHSSETASSDKAVRLIEYLLQVANLRSKLIRDCSEYKQVFWINDIPKENGCFTQAWGQNEGEESDIWIEIQHRKEPSIPPIPNNCDGWIDQNSLKNKKDIPELYSEVTIQIKNPEWQDGSDEPEYISQTECLDDHPEIQQSWNNYLDNHWLPWMGEHDIWESIHKVYANLFAIHQDQLRLGEEFELVLCLGLLTWQTPSSHRVRRHLIVANASLEFDAKSGRFTVRSNTDGAKVRLELDMLEVSDQPANAEENANSILESIEDDPWNKDCVEGVLKALAHSIKSNGLYRNSMAPVSNRTSDNPVVDYAPALILRKRSTKGLSETLKRIKESIENGGEIPDGFGDLTETRSHDENGYDGNSTDNNITYDGEIYFPKPSNEEQRCIIEKIKGSNGVLVQGPPGTGKSHTIANLICHLLATGQRILITAKTPRALQVLEELVPDELRSLCINLLGSGLEEKQSLENSVSGILHQKQQWNEDEATAKCKLLEKDLFELRKEKVKVERRIRDIRESETHSQSIAEGSYKGTAARIAESVNRDRELYEWFNDSVSLNETCSISADHLQRLLTEMRRFTPDLRYNLGLAFPENIETQDMINELFSKENSATEKESRSKINADEKLIFQLSQYDDKNIQAILDSFLDFQCNYTKHHSSSISWVHEALRDVVTGNSIIWKTINQVTGSVVTILQPLAAKADKTQVESQNAVSEGLLEDTCKLINHLNQGRKLGWGPFRSKLVKQRSYILKKIRVNGRSCNNLDQLKILADATRVQLECDKAWRYWEGYCKKSQGPYVLQLAALTEQHATLTDLLTLESIITRCRQHVSQFTSIREPLWTDESQIQQIIASCRLVLARNSKNRVTEKINHIQTKLAEIVDKGNSHPVVEELLKSIRERYIAAYERTANQITNLINNRKNLRNLDYRLSKLVPILPNLVKSLYDSCDDPVWDERVQLITDAWNWSQARFWIEEYIQKEDSVSLTKRVNQIESEISTIIAKLASLHAWSFCFSRLIDSHQQHMISWQQSMKRIGKGTGKHAPKHRREAQKHLNNCREAVPAWVMPLHRIWDTIDPAPGMFDIVIVDEASQCGLESIPLLYLGKKILIVGDDKQISPPEGGVERNQIFQLMKQKLHDFEHQDSFHIDASLFDQGNRLFGNQKITLREHFRCMPEIIRFSNELCYSNTPLIPLRQYGPDRIPPLEHQFVEEGYREGKNQRVINRPEANELVSKVVELCKNPQYINKTMGVIVLQGKKQAGLIEEQLLERLGVEEMQNRRLICGDAYSFQGDERDVMFLSMVAAPNERIGSFTKATYERSFNVAASRARDQMWLFHSVHREDLSPHCLRRKLLEFFENKSDSQFDEIVDWQKLEHRAIRDNRQEIKPPAPFNQPGVVKGSWFEVDVALMIHRKGYRVIPQFPIAGNYIDLVVEGGQARLAVECDGDHWHGADRYEDDMARQRKLERCGWEFFRIRESSFYANKEESLQELWQLLAERGILSYKSENNSSECVISVGEMQNEIDDGTTSTTLFPTNITKSNSNTNHNLQSITTTEIANSIIQALEKCPHYSCTIDSLTSRVLKELGIITRGKPRKIFELRVKRSLTNLKNQNIVIEYKSKNKRIKLNNGAGGTRTPVPSS